MSYEQKTHWNFKCIKLFYIYFWPGVKNRRRNTIGYLFPGERSACYSADMLLRQYKRVRRELGKKFHYRDIKKVYTIVLFEKSNSVFKSFSKDIYEEIYNICRNSERMMGMFSKELEILDRNTVKLMITSWMRLLERKGKK